MIRIWKGILIYWNSLICVSKFFILTFTRVFSSHFLSIKLFRGSFFCSFVKIPFKKHDLIIPVEGCFVKWIPKILKSESDVYYFAYRFFVWTTLKRLSRSGPILIWQLTNPRAGLWMVKFEQKPPNLNWKFRENFYNNAENMTTL